MENNERIKQLLIIGNGFDLACGLKSKYTDFFYSIPKKEYENNFWYYIFDRLRDSALKHSNNWADIELQILNQLKNLEFLYKDNFIQKIDNHHDTLTFIKIFLERLQDNTNIDSLDPESLNITYEGISITKNESSPIPQSIELAQNFVLEHLHNLEKDFCTFLSNQINEERNKNDEQTISKIEIDNYFSRSIKLLNHIFRSYYKSTPSSEVTTFSNKTTNPIAMFHLLNDILSFNYTTHVQSYNWCSIHGSLETENIIFGINYDSLISHFTNPPIQFSKSYRILENSLLSNIRLSKDIKNILFYGHGLSEADYAYFQSIFDSVDLYHGNTRIIFFWDAYDEDKKLELHKEMLNKVVNLIEKYGQTFSNKDHGRNLLTKLKIENRILIKEIFPKEIFKQNIQY